MLTSKIMIDTIRVSSKGQIVIPEHVRKNLHITAGTKLILIEREDRLEIRKEEDVAMKLIDEGKESAGWLALAEESLKDVWDNPKDDEIWKKYL